MANTIELAKVYTQMLDEVYKEEATSSILDGASDLARQGNNANEIVIPKMEMDGLGTYGRDGTGYPKGSVKVEYETVKCGFDRGKMFEVDELDNQETGGIAFGMLAGEFIRTKVVPEVDAYRYAAYATKATKATGTLTTGDAIVKALRAGITAMDDAEVPANERYLFATSDIIGKLNDMDTTKSREIISEFAGIIKVPQTDFVLQSHRARTALQKQRVQRIFTSLSYISLL